MSLWPRCKISIKLVLQRKMLLSDKHVSACGPCSFYLYICAEYSKKKKKYLAYFRLNRRDLSAELYPPLFFLRQFRDFKNHRTINETEIPQ